MLRAALICSFLCLPLPAIAGDRPVPALKPTAPAVLPRDPATAYGRKPALPLKAESAADAKPTLFMLPANSARLEARHPMIDTGQRDKVRQAYDSVSQNARDRWDLTPGIDETTSARGGSYAVRDILRAQPRRGRPGSPLAAALVFRLDGQEESEPFSIGGGGVAAALWQVVPKE